MEIEISKEAHSNLINAGEPGEDFSDTINRLTQFDGG